MFNLLDRWYSWKEHSIFSDPSDVLIAPSRVVVGDSPVVRVAILPSAVISRSWLSSSFVSSGTRVVVPVSARYHMHDDLELTYNRLLSSYAYASGQVNDFLRRGFQVDVLGVSLGTALASRLASSFPVRNLSLVVPGDRLGECALESSITGPLLHSRVDNVKYCDALRDYDLDNHVRGYGVTGSVRVFVGGQDIIIPSRRGLVVADKIRSVHATTQVSYWPLADHLTTIFFASRALKRSLSV